MAIIKIVSKSGLSELATKAKAASETYAQAIEDSHNTVNIKCSGSYSDALKAFEKKLNDLSYKVFSLYPSVLNSYGSDLEKYVSEIEGAGFTSETLRSQRTPIKNVNKWLTTDTYNVFVEMQKSLDPALKKGQSALELSPHSVSYDDVETEKILESAEADLKALGKNRIDTHDKLQSALEMFKSQLESKSNNLTDIILALKNASSIGSIPFGDLAYLIKEGLLTEENMSELDKLQAKGDGPVLVVMLKESKYKSSEEYFTALGSIDTTDTSSVMMDQIHGRVYIEYIEAESGNTSNLGAFVSAISNQDASKAKIYTEKMIEAGDRRALIIGGEATSLIPELPEGATEADYQAYEAELAKNQPTLVYLNSELNRVGLMTSLFESMYLNNVGKNAHNKGAVSEDRFISPDSIKFTKNGDQGNMLSFDIQVKTVGYSGETNVIIKKYAGAAATYASEASDEYKKLNEKRAKAMVDFALDLSVLGPSAQLNYMIPTLRNGITIMDSEGKRSDKIGTITTQNNLNKSYFGDTYGSAVGKKPAALAGVLKLADKLIAVEEEKEKLNDQMKKNLYSIGGYAFDNTQEKIGNSTSFKMSYDLQSILQADDMDKNGLRGYLYRQASQNGKNISAGVDAVNQFDKAISSYKPVAPPSFLGIEQRKNDLTLIDEEMRQYLAGQGESGKTPDMISIFDSFEAMQNSRAIDGDPFGIAENDNFNVDNYIDTSNEYFTDLLRPSNPLPPTSAAPSIEGS